MKTLKRLRRTAVAAAAAALAAVAVPAAVPAASASPLSADGSAVGPIGTPAMNAGQCAPNIAYIVPGGANTAAGLPTNLPFGAYTAEIGVGIRNAAPGRVIDKYIAYQSIPGGLSAYNDTSGIGLQNLTNAVARDAAACPGAAFSFVGYSEGGDIVSRFLGNVHSGSAPIGEDRVASAFLMGSPNRGVPGVINGGSAGATQGAFGALPGGYGDMAGRVMEFCNAGDLVCDSPLPMTTVARQLATTALLRGEIPAGQIAAEVNALSPAQKAQFIAELPPMLLFGMFRHTDYYSSAAPVAAVGHVVSHLA